MTQFDFTLDEIEDVIAEYNSKEITQKECKDRLVQLIQNLMAET